MTKRKVLRVDVAKVTALIVYVDGYKTIKDSDLAALFGIGVRAMYDRIGAKLWELPRNSYFKVAAPKGRRRSNARPSLAFSQSGVVMVASVLGDDASLQVGAEIAFLLQGRRRASAHKKRPALREEDPEKTARYYEARATLTQGKLHDLLTRHLRRRH
ncbi:hypothetical protein [Steroidobacter sp.]|uniref:hypothetical protein n=1 Tax=Steroidobacter sp. TaxID=1978227 RepID=UPI001A42985D|nr:hypothetical protein [Steroidobacter sp.]MBL8266597.1 hypothetical protein [Steroidobacter sp.]